MSTMVDPLDPDFLAALVSQIQEAFPTLDNEVCTLVLEDNSYDVHQAITACVEFFFDEAVAPSPDSTSSLSLLQSLFPSISLSQLEFIIEASGGNVESARILCETLPANPALDELRRLCPKIPDPDLTFWLDAAGGDPRQAHLLLEPPESAFDRDFPALPKSPHPFRFFPPSAIAQPPIAQPASKKKKQKTPESNRILMSLSSHPPPPDPVESLVSLGFNRERASEALALVDGDPERAANLLFTDNPIFAQDPDSNFGILRNIFPTTPREDINASLEEAEGDIERASAILCARLDEQPPPEHAIIAVRPDFSLDQARTLLNKTNGDVVRARTIARRAPMRRTPDRRPSVARDLWIDLHGYTSQEASAVVREAVRNAQRAGNISTIRFCTGKGLHSPGGVSVLRPLVMHICKECGCGASLGANRGMVCCQLPRKP
jgi:DNA-nicking Smr family endonuclease